MQRFHLFTLSTVIGVVLTLFISSSPAAAVFCYSNEPVYGRGWVKNVNTSESLWFAYRGEPTGTCDGTAWLSSGQSSDSYTDDADDYQYPTYSWTVSHGASRSIVSGSQRMSGPLRFWCNRDFSVTSWYKIRCDW